VAGTFCRSALCSKSGSRSPLWGVLTALIIIVSPYGLTPAFYYIPYSVLCTCIIHAVDDLIASPREAYRYWRVSPIEFFIWFTTVFVTIFLSIEDGIYVSVP
jgi:sodium-independent sulfate anion transporter 11